MAAAKAHATSPLTLRRPRHRRRPEVGADRVLFGTDAPMRDPRPQVGWVAFTRLAESDKRKIYGDNFASILRRAGVAL